jgi:cell division protein ZapA (FtsZ GTPase activity inhibitor)
MTPEMIEADIARQREDLAHTVQDLQVQLKDRARRVAVIAAAGVGVMATLMVALKVYQHRNS